MDQQVFFALFRTDSTKHFYKQILRITLGIEDKRSGTVQSPYIQNRIIYWELHPVYRTREVVLCRILTCRIRTGTENYTQYTGQEKWYCAESIHCIQDRKVGWVEDGVTSVILGLLSGAVLFSYNGENKCSHIVSKGIRTPCCVLVNPLRLQEKWVQRVHW